MKKIFIALSLALMCTLSNAQSNLHYVPVTFSNSGTGTVQKVFADMSLVTDNSVTYTEISKTFQDSDHYIQIFHEHRFWDEPIYVHVELRDQSFSGYGETMLMVGGAYDVFTENGMIAIEPLLRLDGEKGNWGKAQPMLSVVTGHDWKVFNLNSFTDFWYDSNYTGSGFNWYSEAWAYFKLLEHVQLGAILTASYSEPVGFSVSAAPGLKIVF